MEYEGGRRILTVIDQWKILWNSKTRDHEKLEELDETILVQSSILCYQIVSSYTAEEHNLSTLMIIKALISVIVSILVNKQNQKEGKIQLKKIKQGLNVVVGKFCITKVKKVLRREIDEINENIIHAFMCYE